MGVLAVALLAYGLVQKDVPGVKVVFILILITMLFNGGLVPTYLIYTNVLHVKNTIFGLILPNLLMSGFTVILVKNYFSTSIPPELFEAAEIDGAGQVSIFFKIVFPLSTPILATVGTDMASGKSSTGMTGKMACIISATISCTASSSFLMK